MRTLSLIVLATLVAAPAQSGKKSKEAPAEPAPAAAPAPEGQKMADYRHNLFESLGKHMKLSSMIVKGQVDLPADMKLHAHALHGAALSIPNLFPEGTDPASVEETDALPSIWEDPEGFKAATQKFQDATAKLVEAADAGDLNAFKASFGAVGASCGNCHRSYRKDD